MGEQALLLKRLYDRSVEPPRFLGLKVKHAGPRQKFTILMVEELMRDGLMTMEGNVLILHAEAKQIRYRIVRQPGFYCCYCNHALKDSDEARRHVTTHDTSVMADSQNPSGYRLDHFYDCVREADHEIVA